MSDYRRRRADETATIVRSSDDPDRVVLLVRSRTGVGATTLVESAAFVIGRASDADIVVDDESVSRKHARLTHDGGWRIEDLGSRNGTLVDGRRLRAGEIAPLALGSHIALGATSAVLETPARILRAPAAEKGASASIGDDIVVRDEAMQHAFAMLDRVAPSPLPVLLIGETGVGKEVFAREVHARSARRDKPLVQLNCAAIPAGMLESELFGYERGAFTGATQAKPGLLELAEGGTVFLDEVGELPLPLQAKLLRTLETGEAQRLGALKPRALDVRWVSATNRELRGAIAKGEFRADLYHRLDGVTIRIPPLRERRADILPLAERFASRMAVSLGRPEPRLADDARAALEAHDWPGNVRELKNAVERAVVLAIADVVAAADLLLPAQAASMAPATIAPQPIEAAAAGLRDELDAVEKRRVIDALERCGNNQSRAAKMLGISRHALISRIERFELTRPRKPVRD